MWRIVAALMPLLLLFAVAAPTRATEMTPSPDATPEASLLIAPAPMPPLIAPAPYSGSLPIATPADAHAAVLASGAPFQGYVLNTGSLIGASQYFDAKFDPTTDLWTVNYTFGWGDCQAGCINTHVFTYTVAKASGAATFMGDLGADLPSSAPNDLVQITMHHPPVDVPVHPVALDACPAGITNPTSTVSSDQVLPCLLPDGSVFPSDAGVSPDGTDWGALYDQWTKQYAESLPACADGVTADSPFGPTDTTCRLADGTVHGIMPLLAMNTLAGMGDDAETSWTNYVPAAVLAVLVAWSGASLVVGTRKRRSA